MLDTGEVVQPQAPHFLTQIAATARANRLDLANWVTSPKNPLTARVFVNRLWAMYFGVGLSKNVVDFGVQGEPPVHPELLDWLASEFMGQSSAWDIKHLIRLMVTSRSYRQSSAARPDLMAKDPYNRLYARQSAPRLDAEFVRDVALSAAGMLSSRVGGPSAHPYEPKGYLASLNFPRREWATGVGEDLYRRGLYTFWQRTFLHPSLLAFDAPTREEVTCSRTVSNTPMQALTLMNDPIFVEASRVFAERMMRSNGKQSSTFDSRLATGFELALSRRPSAKETSLLRTLFDRELARYRRDPEAAKSVVSEGDWPAPEGPDNSELAAWTIVARVILNLHETITRS